MAGFVLIDQQGLFYFQHDFPDIPQQSHMSNLGLDWLPHLALARILAAWFSCTAMLVTTTAS